MNTNTALPTRPLGTTGMNITRVGFGAWAIGGPEWTFGWGAQDDGQSVAAIHAALEGGVNWIDTAAAYGIGHSEEIVAHALHGIARDRRPFVFTKGGLVSDPANPHTPPRKIGTRANLQAEVEASLKRLQVERIDLYQIHWPSDDVPLEAYWQTLLDLKQAGKLRAIGLSNHNATQLAAAEAIGHVDTLQPPFSAIRRASATNELPWCAEHDTGVIVYSPMQSGLLSGSFTQERAQALPENDWRSRSAEFTGDGLRRNLALAEAMRPVAARHGTSVGAVAIAWTLAFPAVTGAIVGARNPAQVQGWLDAASLVLSTDDLTQIATAMEQTGAGTGPTKP